MNSVLARCAFVAVALGFCAYGVISQWAAITEALSRMSPEALVGALGAGMAGLACWMFAWRALLAGFGGPLPVRAAIRVMFLGQLGKYVPGSVWAVVGQVELARGYGIARVTSGAATIMAMATTIAAGCAVAAATLPLTSAEAARGYWWALALAPVLLACLHPRIVTAALNKVLRLARRPVLERPVRTPAMAVAVAWTVAGWLLFGLHAWLLMPGGSPLLATGAYALAYIAGFLVVFAPGGLGAREAALVLALAPALDRPGALVVALASRVVLTVADLAWAGIGALQPRPSPGNETSAATLVPEDDSSPRGNTP